MSKKRDLAFSIARLLARRARGSLSIDESSGLLADMVKDFDALDLAPQEPAAEPFSPGKLDIHSPADFKWWVDLATKQGHRGTCSWFIGALRNHDDNRWVPAIILADECAGKFAFCYELGGGEAEVLAFCARLRAIQRHIDSDMARPQI